MSGRLTLEGSDQPTQALQAGDAFVVPPGIAVRYAEPSTDLELLEVSLTGTFTTTLEDR
jgi:quercetin dioxygenase-like cupin family protein